MGGTASYRNRDLARWLAGLGPVQVWSDGDRAGVEASGVLAKRVAALGGPQRQKSTYHMLLGPLRPSPYSPFGSNK